jgi:thioredoxin 1
MITIVNNDNFEAEVLQSSIPVLVDLYADWCGPCKMQAPVVEELAENAADFKVCKLNVDEAVDVALKYRVASIPTILVFRGGEVAAKAVGYQSKEELLSLLETAKNA